MARAFRAIAVPLGLLFAVGCRGHAPGPKFQSPNVILYIIDGAAADLMSVYGHDRRTTPYLERLAAEGALFENAYSNSSVTKISVPSFMTSLHGSVLGGSGTEGGPLPVQAVPMAERMRAAGYATWVLTSNPFCGRISGLDRGVDVMRDTGPRGKRLSSSDLHREFQRLRDERPSGPYWVHFQPTDVHQPWIASASFPGLFTSPEERMVFGTMLERIDWDPALAYEENVDRSGIDRARFYGIARSLYEEALAFQDRTIGKLIERLKKEPEWENTLVVVAADHSHVSAGLPFFAPAAPAWEAPLLASQKSRVPMIFVWPGKIPAGRRIKEPVSMIDLLPTVLDLAGLARPKIAQGRSLVPLLLGKSGWKPRPVVFDEFYVDEGRLFGSIEVIDGGWGASLWIDTRPEDRKTPRDRLRPAPLLIFDVEKDPHALKSLHKERPDLVEKYSKMLGRIWKEHQALARKFTKRDKIPMTPDEIEALRSLGYLR